MPDPPGSGRPRARPVVAAIGGALVAFSLPPWGWWPLAFVGVTTFEVALGDGTSRRSRAGIGFAFALPWMLIGMAWMWFLTAPGYLITSVLFAGLHAGAAALAPQGPWSVVGRPAAHTLAEAVRMLVPFGGVPLATLGTSIADSPFLVLARIGGVLLMTWFVLAVGALLGADLRAAAGGEPVPLRVPPRVLTLGAIVLVLVGAAVAPGGRDVAGEPVHVAAVQGGGEQGTSALDVPSSRVTQAHLDATATIEPSDRLDVVVWPENGVDVDRTPLVASDEFAAIAAQADRLDVPLVVGVTIDSEFSAHPRDGGFVNAQVVISPDGDVTGSYEKVRIVPFGEYVPLRGLLEAVGAPVDQIASDAVRGRDPAVLRLPDGTTLGVMISWEVFFGDRGRAAADAEILINPTNGASYTGTIVQTQQVASSRLRAMETGRWVVQVSPTGFSAFVSPDGDVLQRTDVSERRVIAMDVPRRTGTTWYTAVGDPPWIAALLIALTASVWMAEVRPRRRRVTPRAAA